MKKRIYLRLFIPTFLLALLFSQSCRQAGRSSTSVSEDKSPASATVSPDVLPVDTIKRKRTDTTLAVTPDTAALVRLLKAGDGLGYEALSVEQMAFANGKVYALVEGSYVNCGFTYWVLYEGGAIKKCVELEKECDDDLSQAEYDYKHYEAVSDTLFRVFKVTQTVRDRRHLDRNGDLKGHASRDDFELKDDTVTVVISPSFLLSGRVPNWPKVWTK